MHFFNSVDRILKANEETGNKGRPMEAMFNCEFSFEQLFVEPAESQLGRQQGDGLSVPYPASGPHLNSGPKVGINTVPS